MHLECSNVRRPVSERANVFDVTAIYSVDINHYVQPIERNSVQRPRRSAFHQMYIQRYKKSEYVQYARQYARRHETIAQDRQDDDTRQRTRSTSTTTTTLLHALTSSGNSVHMPACEYRPPERSAYHRMHISTVYSFPRY